MIYRNATSVKGRDICEKSDAFFQVRKKGCQQFPPRHVGPVDGSGSLGLKAAFRAKIVA
jgi:hypothetical protein